MRSYRYLIISLALLLCLDATAALRFPLHARQDDSPASARPEGPASTGAAASPSPSSAGPSEAPSATETQSEKPSRTPTDAAASRTISVTTTTLVQPPTEATLHESQPSSTSEMDSTNPLPIHPKLTPAMGLTGVILLISGAVYAVIGIKNKWLYIFFSAAYLTSLAVTVLIVYLMNPPVSDAIQGAFFVAACLSGLIFGALSLVFSDITDGLGCLLGGFCLSMWFLSLKEGGLIASITGRAIFIGSMSVAGFSLSFSHYTRTYGLIVSISFAGATITMLGIDCLSRAGWKEFWLYLWGLNENIFPLFTDTYPITRGIKVEVACVVLLTIFGIMSQLKLWKIVKERREKNAAARLERDQRLQQEEEELGRRIEDDFSRERVQWEATYGNKTQQQDSVMESSDRSTPKTSISVRDHDGLSSESVEMVDLPRGHITGLSKGVARAGSKQSPTRPAVTVTVLNEEDEIQAIDGQGEPLAYSKDAPSYNSEPPPNANSSARASSDFATSGRSGLPLSLSTRNSLRSSVPPAPVVVPLPFPIPTEKDERSDEADNASVSAVPESMHESLLGNRPLSKHLSGGSVMKRFSAYRASRGDIEGEALIVPHIEDDRASSLAATLDDADDVSLPELTPPHSPVGSMFKEQTDASISLGDAIKPRGDIGHGKQLEERDTRAGRVNNGRLDLSMNNPTQQTRPDARAPEAKHVSIALGTTAGSPTGPSPTETDFQQSLTISTDPKPGVFRSNRVSSSNSRRRSDTVASQDEGNDSHPWKPARSGAPSISSHTGSQVGLSKEALPERLSKVALSYRTNEWAKHLELAESPELDDIPEPGSPGVKIWHGPEERPAPITDEIRGIEPMPTNKRASKRTSSGSNAYRSSNLMHSTSNMSRDSLTDRVGPQSGSAAQNRGVRRSSNPYYAQPNEITATRTTNTPSPLPGNTLMGQREALVRNKVSSHSLSPQSSSPNLPSALDQENMTLAQRKQLIQHQKPPSASQQWRQSSVAEGGQTQGFDSHQPRRLSGGINPNRREVMLANWRESMRQDGTPGYSTTTDEEGRRMALMNERRQKETEKQQRASAAKQRESMMDSVMRSGDMLDAHREAMRRMQAKANKNA